MSFRSVSVVGDGRVGRAVSARLAERGLATSSTTHALEVGDADLVLLCVPDRAVPEVAARLTPGPWVAHTSGARTLDALEPHAATRRFSLHPLQTFTLERGAEQLDGAWAAIGAESDEAREAGLELAGLLGLRPFVLDDDERPLYHAGATVAASFLVTLHEIAADLFRAAGAPPEALAPLMLRTIENGFRPTGPHIRGDWETIERHLEEIREHRPELEPLYQALSQATALQVR
jgi:predicted short-subunit dehydrogenase-like oxidoreductase (DUF2520 family)